jgi:hypothetical protein
MRPSRGLPGSSICLTLTDVTGRLRIRTPVPETERPDAVGGRDFHSDRSPDVYECWFWLANPCGDD